jgi:two-component system, OmpR family, alkaline phosphatase synthesis response regulator PhoP
MKKILIVDDEQDIREVIKKKLEENKFSVRTAANGEEALVICKSDKPDLVILDIAMPLMDGYQVCENLRKDKTTQDIPVLFLTSKDLSPESILEHSRDLGACGYLPKPSSIGVLLEKIKEILFRDTA